MIKNIELISTANIRIEVFAYIKVYNKTRVFSIPFLFYNFMNFPGEKKK